MKTYVHTITVDTVIGNLHRPKHVLIAILDKQNNIILSEKKQFYPKDIYRCIGGGVEEAELEVDAALREVYEEIGLVISPDMLIPLAKVTTKAKHINHLYVNETTIYVLHIDDVTQLNPGDDISGLIALTKSEFLNLIQRYEHLPDSPKYVDGEYVHSWKDYGKMYGYIHKVVHDILFH